MSPNTVSQYSLTAQTTNSNYNMISSSESELQDVADTLVQHKTNLSQLRGPEPELTTEYLDLTAEIATGLDENLAAKFGLEKVFEMGNITN